MSDDERRMDPELEARLRAAFARLDPPPAPPSLVAATRAFSDRPDRDLRRPWATRLPFAFAAIAVLVSVGLATAVLSVGRHSTTQGEEPLTPGATPTLESSTPPGRTSGPPTAMPASTSTPSPSPRAATVPSLVSGHYRSTGALDGKWCLDFQLARELYLTEEQIEVSTWPPTEAGTCPEPPDPDSDFVPYKGWNRGTIGPLEDGTPAIFVQLVVDLESPFQELDLALEIAGGELLGKAASFGGERVAFRRVGPAAAAAPPEAGDDDETWRHGEIPPDDVPPATTKMLPLAGWEAPGQVTCQGEPFPIAGLRAEPGAERRAGPEFDALRAAIDWSGDPAMQGAWREAGRTSDWVIFVTEVRNEVWYVTTTFRDGKWQYAGLGDCMQLGSTPPGYSVGYWQLDPAYRAPRASSTRVHLLVTEERCAGGRSAEGRISPAYVFEHDTEVTIQVFVEDPGRGQDCRRRAPPTPVTVELPVPLGDRSLRDPNVPCRFCGG